MSGAAAGHLDQAVPKATCLLQGDVPAEMPVVTQHPTSRGHRATESVGRCSRVSSPSFLEPFLRIWDVREMHPISPPKLEHIFGMELWHRGFGGASAWLFGYKKLPVTAGKGGALTGPGTGGQAGPLAASG